jgi:hypothetical protein
VTQLGGPAAITLRPAGDPTGVGLDIEFTAIPNTFDGLSISLDEINSTFDSLRFPDCCPATPATVIVSADSYLDPTVQAGSAPLKVTGCGSLPFAPGFAVSVTKDSGDSHVAVSTDITQTTGQADARSVSLAFPSNVLAPNLGVVSALCADPTTGTCTSIGSAKAISPLYPAPLTGQAYLTGSLTAPALTLVFGPPFSLALTGTVDLSNNSTTFTGIPDFPLTDLGVTLNGGSHAVFEAACRAASGVATANLTAQNGDQTASASTPFTVSGCGSFTGGGKGGPGGNPQLHAVTLTGLADGKPSLLFQLVAGKNAPSQAELVHGGAAVRRELHQAPRPQGAQTNRDLAHRREAEVSEAVARSAGGDAPPSRHERDRERVQSRPEGESGPAVQDRSRHGQETEAEGDRPQRRRREHHAHGGAQDAEAEGEAYVICFVTRAGAPTAIENGGTSLVTTELAPITDRSPIVTPLVMTTLAPHQTLSPIRVGPLVRNPCQVIGRPGSSNR